VADIVAWIAWLQQNIFGASPMKPQPIYCDRLDGVYEAWELIGGSRRLLYAASDLDSVLFWAIGLDRQVIFG
jgi:hypothetical protein